MSEPRRIARVDRVLIQRYWNTPLRAAYLLAPTAGDLLVTTDGTVAFVESFDSHPIWQMDLSQITDVDETAASFGHIYMAVGNRGKMLRATFDGKRLTVRFTGYIPVSLSAFDNVLSKLPTRLDHGLGKLWVVAKVEYQQRTSLPDQQGEANSVAERAREACAWWVKLFKGEIALQVSDEHRRSLDFQGIHLTENPRDAGATARVSVEQIRRGVTKRAWRISLDGEIHVLEVAVNWREAARNRFRLDVRLDGVLLTTDLEPAAALPLTSKGRTVRAELRSSDRTEGVWPHMWLAIAGQEFKISPRMT